MASRKQERYSSLRLGHFTPHEARQLAILARDTPALRLARDERQERWNRFERIAAAKIAHGKWQRQEVPDKWVQNLSRMYTRRNWRVQEGPVGDQPKMAKRSPNPWALYRSAEDRTGGTEGKGYLSPWQLVQSAKGKTKLEKGLIFVQKAERSARRPGGVNREQIAGWIREKEEAIRDARSEKRKQQLIIERNRLERLL